MRGWRRTGWIAGMCLLWSGPLFAQDELRDVKPPVDVTGTFAWWWLAAVLSAALAAWYLVRRYRSPAPPAAAPPAPDVLALAALDAILARDLIGRGEVKAFYIELSDVVRTYLESRFQVRAPEMTTEEFLRSVRLSQRLSPNQQEALRGFMEQSDQVKFARRQAGAEEMRASFDLAKRFVQETREPPPDPGTPPA